MLITVMSCARLGAAVPLVALVAGCGAASERPPDALEGPPPISAGSPREPERSLVSGHAPEAGAATLNRQLLRRASLRGVEADPAIGPGDLIEVTVFQVEELSKLKVRVPLKGIVTLPLIGPVEAAGRAPVELEEDIRARLQQRYMHDPQVSVFVHEQRSQRISVVGAVQRGGVYPLVPPMRLADALALAEGLANDADHVIYLSRHVPAGTVEGGGAGETAGTEPTPDGSGAGAPADEGTQEILVPIDLDALASGADELDVRLRPGDVIHVPRVGSFYVGGSVERPGSYVLRSRMTVDQAVLAAGGVKNVADEDDVRVYRRKPGSEREILTFSLSEFERGGAVAEIQKDDVVIVGKSGGKAFFYGFIEFFRGVFGVSKGL